VHAISLDTPLKRNPDLIWTDMDGETVMMSIERGEYLGLGGAGSRIWELLEEPVTPGEICARVAAEFEVDPDTCKADVVSFLGELVEKEVIRQE
jgi:hypothetical protein